LPSDARQCDSNSSEVNEIGQDFELLGRIGERATFFWLSSIRSEWRCAHISLTSGLFRGGLRTLQPLLFVIKGNQTLLKAGFLPDTLLMKTSKPRVADIIRAVAETLDVICLARGIEVRDLDEAAIDKLLWSAYEEHLGDGTLVSDTSWWP
jgi:hypothetical protein